MDLQDVPRLFIGRLAVLRVSRDRSRCGLFSRRHDVYLPLNFILFQVASRSRDAEFIWVVIADRNLRLLGHSRNVKDNGTFVLLQSLLIISFEARALFFNLDDTHLPTRHTSVLCNHATHLYSASLELALIRYLCCHCAR